MKGSQMKGQISYQLNQNDQSLETKKYHNYSLAFYQKDAALN
jgi:hypothetical protein